MLFLVALGVLVVGALLMFGLMTERQRDISVARLRKPASMAAYEQLAEKKGTVPSERSETRLSPFSETPLPAQQVEDTLTAYKRLFAAWEQWPPEDQAQWTEAFELLRRDPDTWTAEERSNLMDIVGAHQDLLDEIRRLAKRGGPVYPLDLSKGFVMELDYLARMRDFGRMLCANAIVQAQAGNIDGALDDIIAGMQLGDALAREPILISQLVRIAMYNTMNDAVRDAFHPGELTTGQTRRVVEHLARADNRQAFADSLSTEAILGLRQFAELSEQSLVFPVDSVTDVLAGQLYDGPIGRPWRNMDAGAYADIMGRAAETAQVPYYEAETALTEIDHAIAELSVLRVFSRMILPGTPRALEAQARHEATLDLIQMGLLLELYCGQHGAYPESLDTIAPDLGGTLPRDPFTGEAYRYEPSSERFLLYSVGPNQIDDGGRHDRRDADLLWRGRVE